MGELPEWYRVAKAAQFWRMNPQDVIQMPVFWVDVAFDLSEAETRADEMRQKVADKRKGEPTKGTPTHGRKRRR